MLTKCSDRRIVALVPLGEILRCDQADINRFLGSCDGVKSDYSCIARASGVGVSWRNRKA